MLITILWMSPLLTAYPAIVDSCADVNRQVCQRSVWEVSCWVEDRRKREEDTGRKLFVPYSLGKIKPLFSLQECPTPSLKNNVLIGCADDNRPPTQVTVVLVRGSINCASCCHFFIVANPDLGKWEMFCLFGFIMIVTHTIGH